MNTLYLGKLEYADPLYEILPSGDGASLKKKLSKLVSFLYIFHKKTEKEENVELDSANVYFQKILNKLCQQEIIYPSDKKEYLKLADI
jgi:hypothetical protein